MESVAGYKLCQEGKAGAEFWDLRSHQGIGSDLTKGDKFKQTNKGRNHQLPIIYCWSPSWQKLYSQGDLVS